MPSDKETIVLAVDVLEAYLRGFTNLIAWYASFGGQLGSKGDGGLLDTTTVATTVSMASTVRDAEFRSVVLKAGAAYLNRVAEQASQGTVAGSIAA